MKIFVEITKGTDFEIEVKPVDKISDVKKAIETLHGAADYPAAQQMLIHQGKVLKDDSTLEENNIVDKSFILIKLSKVSSSGALTASSSAAVPTPACAAGAGAGSFDDFVRNDEQFKVLRALVQLQGTPQIVERILQELSNEHPHLEGFIQAHQAELVRVICEPLKGKKNIRERLEDLIDHLHELRNNLMKEIEQLSSFPSKL